MPASLTPGAARSLAFAVRHINASARDPIEADVLLAALTSGTVPSAYEHHIRAFFDEIEVETLSDIVRGGAVTYPALARGAKRYLPSSHHTRRWLDERA